MGKVDTDEKKKGQESVSKMDFDILKEISMPTLGRKALEYLFFALIVIVVGFVKSGIWLSDFFWDIAVSGAIVLTVVLFYQLRRTRGTTKKVIKHVQTSEEKCEQCSLSWQSLVTSQSHVIQELNQMLTVSMESDRIARMQLNYYGLVTRINHRAEEMFDLSSNGHISPFDFIEQLSCEEHDKDDIRVKFYDFLASEDQATELDIWLRIKPDKVGKHKYMKNCRKYRLIIHRIVTAFPLLTSEQLKMKKTAYMMFLNDITQVYELENSIQALKMEYERIVDWAGSSLIPHTYKKERKKLAKASLSCRVCGHKWTDRTKLQCPHCESKEIAIPEDLA